MALLSVTDASTKLEENEEPDDLPALMVYNLYEVDDNGDDDGEDSDDEDDDEGSWIVFDDDFGTGLVEGATGSAAGGGAPIGEGYIGGGGTATRATPQERS